MIHTMRKPGNFIKLLKTFCSDVFAVSTWANIIIYITAFISSLMRCNWRKLPGNFQRVRNLQIVWISNTLIILNINTPIDFIADYEYLKFYAQAFRKYFSWNFEVSSGLLTCLINYTKLILFILDQVVCCFFIYTQ